MLEQVVEALAREVVVRAGGPCPCASVVDAIRIDLESLDLDRNCIEELVKHVSGSRDGSLLSFGDTVVDISRLAERISLSHRLDEAEIASARLDLTVDLGGLARLANIDGGLHHDDGSPLVLRVRRLRGAGRAGASLRRRHLEGPPGWLDRFVPGTLVAATAAEGFLSLKSVADGELAPPPDDLSEGLAALIDRANEGDDMPVPAGELQLLAALARPEWFARPRPPFSELAAMAGLELDGDLVGRPGCWEEHRKLVDTVAALSR
ncbi:MAG: hypothetical protein ACRD0S_03765, partial [Acidimicrobiales bacterium]